MNARELNKRRSLPLWSLPGWGDRVWMLGSNLSFHLFEGWFEASASILLYERTQWWWPHKITAKGQASTKYMILWGNVQHRLLRLSTYQFLQSFSPPDDSLMIGWMHRRKSQGTVTKTEIQKFILQEDERFPEKTDSKLKERQRKGRDGCFRDHQCSQAVTYVITPGRTYSLLNFSFLICLIILIYS